MESTKEIDALNEKISKLELELSKYKQENKKLTNKVEHLKDRLDAIIDDKAYEILDYFRNTDSIRRTAWNYGMEMEELYILIPQWTDSDDDLRRADDYIECTIEVHVRKMYDEELEDEFTEEELEQKMRTPDPDTINKIIEDYKNASELSLYQLADRYELWINNLFRLLQRGLF
jgi:ribosomal protein S25